MLKQRVLTALVLLALLLPALFYPRPEPLLLLSAVLLAAAAWEWARINGFSMALAIAVGVSCALICFWLWRANWMAQTLPHLWLVAGALWILLGAWLLKAGVDAWQHVHQGLRLLLGLLALCLTWLALARLRWLGVNVLLSVLALVWVADISAYFFGRAFGTRLIGRKLAPSISPGKSWEGVAGAMVGVVLLALVWRYADVASGQAAPSFYSLLVARQGWVFMLLAVLLLAAMSVVGDLIESLVKRSAGVKDSSALLPGHGGVLDRIDALLPTLALALLLLSF